MTARRLNSMARICRVLAEAKDAAERALAAVCIEQQRLAGERQRLLNAFGGDPNLQTLFAKEIARELKEIALKMAAHRDVERERAEKLAACMMRLTQAEKLNSRLQREADIVRERRELEEVIESIRPASLP